ncbi:uncharacterized protein LOC110600035 isoform X2 [Manihot esculenta]|uniref:uncharacterized protein LOC110600035 isoform X2 n=1 Tax=Manihot esculenta TaxID=3983 RepID=UPI000B5D1B51|nr:uncharacterized protein LOC110600035 isoform X2 [Manihot esculenta]
MAANTNCSFCRATYLFNPTLRPHQPINSLSGANFFKPISSPSSYPNFSLHRQKISRTKGAYRLVEVACLVDDNSETYPEAEPSYSNTGANIDIKLPRRSLLVQFSCNQCGERTERLINRLAYERGLVYVQGVSNITN